MKVLHILGSIERSGAETMLCDAVGRFRAHSIEIELLSTGETPGRFTPAFESMGVWVSHIRFRKSPRFFQELHALVRTGDYDVVHVHTERAALWVELVVRMAGVRRIVRTVHSVFEFSGWLRVRRACGRWVATRILGVHHVFVGPSVERNEVERFRTTGLRVANAVDTDRFAPVEDAEVRDRIRIELGVSSESIVVTSVGSCTDVKQHDHVLQALSLLRGPVPSLHYLHAGDGPNCKAEQHLAMVLGMADCCHFLGERDDIERILQATDIFLMPSRYEGLGLAAIEASACAVPVIAYDVPGLRDAVVDGQTGKLVAPDVRSLAQALEGLTRDSDGCLAYGRAGRAMAVQEYGLDRWVERHVALYAHGVAQ